MSDTVGLVAEAATLDPAVRTRVLALANRALDEAEYLMQYGDPNMRGQVVRTFITAFGKHLRAEETHNELDDLRKSLDELKMAMLGHVAGEDPDEETKPVGRPPHEFDGPIVDSPPVVNLLDRRKNK